MKRKAFGVIGVVLVVFLSLFVGVSYVYGDSNSNGQNQQNQVDDGFLSDSSVTVLFPPNYDRAEVWPVSNFILDSVDLSDISDVGPNILKGLLGVVWRLYLYIALFIIHLVSQAFQLDIINQVSGILQNSLHRIYNDIFVPFLYTMYCVAIAWMVYYWIVGKTTRLWQTMFSTLLIIALSATIFTNLPWFLKQVNQTSSTISNLILDGLLYDQSNNQESSDQLLKFASINTDSSMQLAKVAEPDPGLTPEEKLKEKLSYLFVLKAYKIVDFGSENLADQEKEQKQAWKLLLDSSNTEERQKYVDEMKGQVPFFTADGQYDRMFVVFLVTFFFGFNLICLLIIAVLVIFWQLIAIGRALMAACYLTISLWPEYGLKEAIQWGWSMVHALFMKVFYTIILSVYMTFTMALIDKATVSQNGEKMGYMTACLIGIGTFYGLWMALKELREKLSNIPLDGMYLAGNKGQAAEMLETTAGVGLAGAGAGVALAGAGAAGALRGLAGIAALRTGNKALGDLATKGFKGMIKGRIQDRVANEQKKRIEQQKNQEEYNNFLRNEQFSSDARTTFEQMKKAGYNPANLSDIEKYEENFSDQPDRLRGLDEIKKVAYTEQKVARELGKKQDDPEVKKETMRRLKEEKEAQRKIEEQKRKMEMEAQRKTEEQKRKNREIQQIRELQESRKTLAKILETIENNRSLHNPHNDQNDKNV